jgi:hypothetical protein
MTTPKYYLWCNMPELLPLLFAHSQPLVELIDEAGELGQDFVGQRLAALTSALRCRAGSDFAQPSSQAPTKIFPEHIWIQCRSRKKVSLMVTCRIRCLVDVEKQSYFTSQ